MKLICIIIMLIAHAYGEDLETQISVTHVKNGAFRIAHKVENRSTKDIFIGEPLYAISSL